MLRSERSFKRSTIVVASILGMSEQIITTLTVFLVVDTFRWASASYYLVSRRDDPDPMA